MLIFGRMIAVVATTAVFGALLARADDHDKKKDRKSSDERRSVAAPTDPTYKAECGSCHMLYPAGLLPARSWERVMAGLKDHFGDNATLDKATSEQILKFLTADAADHSSLRRSRKIAKSIPESESPLRVTETSYFKKHHHKVSAKVWARKSIGSPSNCSACHPQAEQGVFSDDDIVIPK